MSVSDFFFSSVQFKRNQTQSSEIVDRAGAQCPAFLGPVCRSGAAFTPPCFSWNTQGCSDSNQAQSSCELG